MDVVDYAENNREIDTGEIIALAIEAIRRGFNATDAVTPRASAPQRFRVHNPGSFRALPVVFSFYCTRKCAHFAKTLSDSEHPTWRCAAVPSGWRFTFLVTG